MITMYACSDRQTDGRTDTETGGQTNIVTIARRFVLTNVYRALKINET